MRRSAWRARNMLALAVLSHSCHKTVNRLSSKKWGRRCWQVGVFSRARLRPQWRWQALRLARRPSIAASMALAKWRRPGPANALSPVQGSSAGVTCTIPPVAGSFSGPVTYSSRGRGFSTHPAGCRAVRATTWWT